MQRTMLVTLVHLKLIMIIRLRLYQIIFVDLTKKMHDCKTVCGPCGIQQNIIDYIINGFYVIQS